LEEHTETVTALAWVPDGSGFISGGLDRQIIHWVSKPASPFLDQFSTTRQDADGQVKESWGTTAIRVTDLAITPDFTRLVTIGMHHQSPTEPNAPPRPPGDHAAYGNTGSGAGSSSPRNSNNRLIVYDVATKQVLTYVISNLIWQLD
jgi:hypothetical protein